MIYLSLILFAQCIFCLNDWEHLASEKDWEVIPSSSDFENDDWVILQENDDCNWVIQIYQAMSDNNAKISGDCCEMRGVQCVVDKKTGMRKVTGIFWNQRRLVGNIPEEIGQLKNLRNL